MEKEPATNNSRVIPPGSLVERTVMSILVAISMSHLPNDTIRPLIPAIYPLVEKSFHLSFTQIALILPSIGLLTAFLPNLRGNHKKSSTA